MSVCWFPWKWTSCSVTLSEDGSCSPRRRRPAFPLVFSRLSVNFSTVAKKKGLVHLLLIYLGHACENRSIFCGSPWGRNRAKGCDCREIKPLKPMLCLVFRAAREPRSLDVLQKHPGSNYSRQRKCACEVEGGKITCLSHWSNIQVLSFAPQEGP